MRSIEGLLFSDGALALDLNPAAGHESWAALAVQVIGKTGPAAVVDLLWSKVVGRAPTVEQAAPFVAMLQAGMTVGALAVLAADTDLNATNIDLVGLAQTGLAYEPQPV